MSLASSLFPSMSSLQTSKMTFTDLIPSLLGQASTDPSKIPENLRAFVNARSPMQTLSQGVQKFQDVFKKTDYLIGAVRNPLIQLFINPQTISVTKAVLHQKMQTRGGFVVQFWGHDLEVITVEAATAYFQLSKEPVRAFELLKNQVYQSRFDNSEPFKGQPMVTMIWENQILKGFFQNFTYRVSADKPFYVTYGFSFTVVEDMTVLLGIGSNLASIISDATKGNGTIHKIANAASINDEDQSLGRGWGIRLY